MLKFALIIIIHNNIRL